ncbi:MAG: sigma-54 dependent transcriptional regulator [Wenzhouxiangellaceae bacterium]|nr:sigma-54 dependent transcriptional regulator [Wenzhouxiangellaceae bacterium]
MHDSIEIPMDDPPPRPLVSQPNPVDALLIGESNAIAQVQRLIRQVARHEQTNVLILGESGTGKELVARGIHASSARANEPFVPVNCGAIPGELLESELFGHEKGAFTGALARRTGRFELADGGTLFLDEIGDMPLQMQVKLLRVLQERVFERVGGMQPIRCDLRIVAATHRNIEQLAADGEFREDLFYRLNVFPIVIPPLRKRDDDLLLLLEHFTDAFADPEYGPVRFAGAALDALLAYPWPGNVRELANFVERMSILHAGETLRPDDLPERYRGRSNGEGNGSDTTRRTSFIDAAERAWAEREALTRAFDEPPPAELPPEGLDLREHLAGIEADLIRQALDQSDYNTSAAARLLKLRRTTLVEKIRKYDLG